MSVPRLTELDLSAFAAALADPGSGVGPGGAAGMLLASGAGLVSMAFRAVTGDPYAAGRAAELDLLRAGSFELLERAAAEGRGGPVRGLDGRMAPLEIMEEALGALRLAAVGAHDVPSARQPDLRAGGLCLSGALEVAAEAVRSRTDETAVLDEVAAMRAEAVGLLAEVRAAAQDVRA